MSKKVFSALTLSVALGVASAGADTLPGKAEMWRMIQQQQKEIQALKEQVHATRQQTEQTREILVKVNEPPTRQESAEEEGKTAKAPHWSDRITLSGTVEVEANTARDFTRTRTSDINLATAELGFDFKINDWVNSRVVLLYEDPDTDPINVDEATVTIGDTSKFPLTLTAGLMTVPFGKFDTNMVSDPLTLELAENSREGTILVGLEHQGFHAALYTFNGDVDLDKHSNTIRQGGARVGYTMDRDDLKLDVGVDYTTSLDDGDNLTTAIQTNRATGTVANHVAALAGHAMVQYAGVTAIGEYVAAQESFKTGELLWGGGRAKPRAWQTELGYTFAAMEKETTLSVGWQGTDEALDLGLPEERLLCAVKVGILENTTLGLEYAHDEDYNTTEGGTGRDGHVATVQLGVTF